MDNGAHFYCCDFQVHTPRDRQWTGTTCVTPDERAAYAATLVDACRVKGLNAIAITDHHDMAFVQYVRNAARAYPHRRIHQRTAFLCILPSCRCVTERISLLR
jgi:hypothetical protein